MTDTGLLADAIEKTDEMIDELHEPLKGETPRPRTYRKKSRKLFVEFVKNRKPSAKVIRKVRGKQLNFLKRNLGYVREMLKTGGNLSNRLASLLETITILYAQQRGMYDNKSKQVDNRIVSISQPHIRPQVRGKAGKPFEFGAKVTISTVKGYTFLDEARYDAYHEGNLLENSIITPSSKCFRRKSWPTESSSPAITERCARGLKSS
jgi:hypothetical protein